MEDFHLKFRTCFDFFYIIYKVYYFSLFFRCFFFLQFCYIRCFVISLFCYIRCFVISRFCNIRCYVFRRFVSTRLQKWGGGRLDGFVHPLNTPPRGPTPLYIHPYTGIYSTTPLIHPPNEAKRPVK